MLFDADPDTMVRAITPSRAKLTAKGVDSVRSHITTVKEHLPVLGIGEFKRSMASALCDSEQMMTPADIAAIESIAARYMSQEGIHGRYTADSAVRPHKDRGSRGSLPSPSASVRRRSRRSASDRECGPSGRFLSTLRPRRESARQIAGSGDDPRGSGRNDCRHRSGNCDSRTHPRGSAESHHIRLEHSTPDKKLIESEKNLLYLT